MHVRCLSLLAGALTLMASVAQAQTQVPAPQVPATAAPPAAASADDWIGIYAGGNLGGLSASFGGPVSIASFTVSGATQPGESVKIGPTGSLSDGSGTIGLQVGYADRLTRSLIGALEFQITKAAPTIAMTVGDQAKNLNDFTTATTLGMKTGAMKSLRARVGTAMTPDVFVYGTLGVAFTSVQATGGFPANGTLPAVLGVEITTMKGLTIGAGAEYAPFKYGTLRALSIGAEFRHASLGTVPFDFADVTVHQSPLVVQPAIGTISVSANEFDVRVNVRFGAWR